MDILLNMIDKLSENVMKVCRWSGIAMVLVILYEVFNRYMLNSPSLWAFDVSLMLYSFFFLMGGSWVTKDKANITVDVLYELFPFKLKKTIDVLFYMIFFFPLCFVLTWYGGIQAINSFRIKEVSNISQLGEQIWYWKAIIPVAFGFQLIQGFASFVRSLKGSETNAC